jgi:hypothetical protein
LSSTPTATGSASVTVTATPRAGTPGLLGNALALPPPPGPAEPLQPYDGLHPIEGVQGSDSFILDVPYRSQYDQSPYRYSNCGPAALGMVLQAYGLDVPTDRLRAIADRLQGTNGYNDGIALDYLQAIALQAGLRTEGLGTPDGHYRQWTMADVIREVRRGYPVITLVHFASLPEHAASGSASDHYVVVVGLTTSGFVINDPASSDGSGYHQVLTPQQLLEAWRASSIPQEAVAFLPPGGKDKIHQIEIQSASVATPAPTLQPPPPPAMVPTSAGAPATAPDNATNPAAPPVAVGDPIWLRRVGAWQHAPGAPTIAGPHPAASANSPTLVLAEQQSADSPLPITGIVVVAIGAVALAILKAPNGEGSDRQLIRRDY